MKLPALALLIAASLAHGQKPLSPPGERGRGEGKRASKNPSPPTPLPQRGEGSRTGRVDAIMGHVNDRLSTQIDVFFDDGDFPASISLLKFQAEAYPADYDVWTNLGWMQENVEQWDAALTTYIRYKRQNPKDADAALPEATYYFNRRLYAKVPPLMEDAIKGPSHPNAYRILARSYEKQDMLGDALRVYKALVQRDPKDLTAQANVRRVEGKMGKGK